MRTFLLCTALLASAAAAWAAAPVPPDLSRPAAEATTALQQRAGAALPWADQQDEAAVRRGLVAPFEGRVLNAAGQTVWDSHTYDFLDAEQAPDTVHPSLWRLARLNSHAGLFRVSDGLYQVRGLDLANMTVIEGRSGLILIDPLFASETARAALELYYQHRPRRPVVAVIYSHSHLDHFGGVRGVVDEADVRAGKVRIYAPAGFMEHAISENVMAGTAMLRRGQFQGGSALQRGVRGQVDAGLGKGVPVGGTITLIAPTDLIEQATELHDIDGVTVEFQLTPDTEAPSEMNLYLPQLRALCMSENAVQMMHNLLTPRGAEVRDAHAWSRYLDDSLLRYGDRSDVMFTQHSWPTWGGEQIRTLLADQRDMYGWMHDRALHLINQGLRPMEIAETMRSLPGTLAGKWYTRSYYGSLSFNVRAVYQRYLGFYDGNPAHLEPLAPREAGRHYVEAMGGADRVTELVRAAMTRGEFRWAAELGNHLVFAAPDNAAARGVQADALEQLGYQSENATWRNMYLLGAQELRGGVKSPSAQPTPDLVRAMTPAMYFDLLAVRLDSDKAQGHDMTLNWRFGSAEQNFALTLRNGVLSHRQGRLHARPDATVTMSKATLDRINLRQLDLATAVQQGEVRVEGQADRLGELLSMMTAFKPMFNVVTP